MGTRRLCGHAETFRERSFPEGSLVLVERGYLERDLGPKLGLRCSGPYKVERVVDAFGATLVEPVTGARAFAGRKVAFARMVAFSYPAEEVAAIEDEPLTLAPIGGEGADEPAAPVAAAPEEQQWPDEHAEVEEEEAAAG